MQSHSVVPQDQYSDFSEPRVEALSESRRNPDKIDEKPKLNGSGAASLYF